MEYIDSYLCTMWNDKSKTEQIIEENMWDLCRILEVNGFLVGDDASISAVTIGPFKIASTIQLKRKDIFTNFLQIVIPSLLSKVNNLSFEQAYALYILPITLIFINLADQCCLVEDMLCWEILMHIKKLNKNNIYPTEHEINKSDEFRGVENWQIKDCLNELKSFKNLAGDKKCLIQVDKDGRIESLV